MKKFKNVAIISVAILVVTGCGGIANDQAANTDTVQQTSGSAPTSGTDQQVSTEASAEEAKMDEAAMVKLVAKANEKYWQVAGGGKSTDGAGKNFALNGKDHRYLSSDLDSKEKLESFLAELYTTEAIEKLTKHFGIVEHEGKLVQPNADGGSLLQWENAQASLAEEAADTKMFELKVPYGEESNIQFEAHLLTVKKVDGKWKLDSVPNIKE